MTRIFRNKNRTRNSGAITRNATIAYVESLININTPQNKRNVAIHANHPIELKTQKDSPVLDVSENSTKKGRGRTRRSKIRTFTSSARNKWFRRRSKTNRFEFWRASALREHLLLKARLLR